MNLHKNLKFLRKKNNLSQEALAEILDVSRQAVAKWENEQAFPDIENLIHLSNYFKISLDKLIKETDLCNFSGSETGHYSQDDEIKAFLCRAKKATYAGKGKESSPSRPNSHDYIYTEGHLKYIDTYLGGERFSGEEALWKNDLSYWSMNYFGKVTDELFSGDFLKEVLLLVEEENPYRGPSIYQNQSYKYHCIIEGDFEWFKGFEEIFFENKKVYDCMFHGGCVK